MTIKIFTGNSKNRHRELTKGFIIIALLCAFILTSCADKPDSPVSSVDIVKSFHDIPDITESEINAIEALIASRQSFSFGKLFSTEGYTQPDGTYAGFSSMLCELLTELFGIPFILDFYNWNSLADGIDSGTIDFTCEYGITSERLNKYHMSDPIAQRSLSILTRNDRKILTPSELNGLKVGIFMDGSAVAETIERIYPELSFEIVSVPSIEVEAAMLRSGEIDAVIGISAGMTHYYTGEADLNLVHGLLPLAYTPIALTTANNELEPVILVLNKYIEAGGINRLYELYRLGNDGYNKNILFSSFTDEEREYINNLSGKIPIVLGTDTYPVSFYNSNENEFQGISLDVLMEISRMTGIEFEPVNEKDATWGEILETLRTGEAALISDLIITEERKEYFIWPQTPFFSTPYAFFSKTEYPNLELYQIGQAAVGVVGWCATRQLYDQWFPNSFNVKLFDSQDEALDALERDEIDLFFNLGYILYYQQNYRERPGFKANYTFPVYNDTFFGLNKNETILNSIIDKTMAYIDTGRISNEWTSRSFDYSRMLAEEQSRNANQRASIVFVSAIFLVLLMVIVVFLILKNSKTKKMAIESEQEANERFRIMLDANPLCCKLWSSEFKLLDCNLAAASLCGFKTKQEYLKSYFDLDPEYQPDGERSVTKRTEYLKRAFNEKVSFSFEWLHILPDGSYMPAEITLVRVKYGTEYVVAGYTRDLRLEKRMIHNLISAQESNELQLTKLNVLIRATKNGLWDVNINNHDSANPEYLFSWSNDFRRMLGYNDEADFPNIEDSWADRIHPDDKDKVFDCFDKHLRDKTGNTPYDIEYRMYRKNGDCGYFRDTCAALRDENGNPIHVTGTLLDITEAKNMEEKLIKAARFNQSIIDTMPVGMLVFCGSPPRIIDCNEELSKMLKAPKQQIIERYFQDFMPAALPDGRSTFDVAQEMTIRSMAGETVRFEWPYYTSDGHLLTCDITLTRVKDETEFTGLGFLYNTSEIRKREQELLHAQEINELQLAKIKIINKAARIGLWDMETIRDDPMNIKNNINYSNGFREILGYTDENDFPDIINSFHDCLHPDDFQMVTNTMKNHVMDTSGKTPYYTEYQAKKKNGEYIFVRATGESIRDENGNALRTLGTIMDISEEKNTLRNTERLRQEAEVASKSKSSFLSNMSHEMRTPMNAIIGMTIIGKKAEDIVQKDHALNKIGDASSHLLGVINDVLDMAKIEANRLELSPVEYNFERMLQKVLSVVNFRIDEKQQRLTLNVDSNIPRFMIGDDQRLAQVITNLLSNAVKFTPEGGDIHLNAALVSEVNGNCELRIEVTDTGIGISPEKHEKLFSAFEQAESGTSRQFGGTGLGLAICKHIIEFMNGNIWVESELGKGAKFIFTVKAQRSDKNPASMLAPGVNWKNVRILAVDDMAETREQFQKLFGQLEIICDTAADGHEACRIIQERGAYDIYFIDWRMPGMDGIELTKKIKESMSSKPSVVIMITAMDWEQIKEEALHAGVNKCLLKPLMSSMIIDCVNESLGIPDEIKEDHHISESEFEGKNLLVAEDVEINREILIALLEDTGLLIDCAENGEEAFKMVEAAPDKYDIVFMDIQMPVMNGYESTRRIRALPERQRGRLPIIALTANVFKSDIDDCLAAGMDDHLGKPLDIDKVIEKLREYLK